MVAVVQREWAAESARHDEGADHGRGRAELADDRLSVPHPAMLPRHRRRRRADPDLADRAKDFPKKPVYILGTGESVETPMVSQMKTFDRSRAFKVVGPLPFKQAASTHRTSTI